MARGDEARVVAAFAQYLEAAGWDVSLEEKFVDVVGRRGAETIYAEAKGRTAAPGLDVHTLYGQLLTRMVAEPDPGMRFAVVLPSGLVKFALRVPTRIRRHLDIDIYTVSDDGDVALVEDDRP